MLLTGRKHEDEVSEQNTDFLSYGAKSFACDHYLDSDIKTRYDRQSVLTEEIKFFRGLLDLLPHTMEENSLKIFFVLYEFNKFSHTVEAICRSYHHSDPPELFPCFFSSLYPSVKSPWIMWEYRLMVSGYSMNIEASKDEVIEQWKKEFLDYFSMNNYAYRSFIRKLLKNMETFIVKNFDFIPPLFHLRDMFEEVMLSQYSDGTHYVKVYEEKIYIVGD